MNQKKRSAIICPGRGSYSKETLGYLRNRPLISEDLKLMDSWRKKWSEPTLSELDGAEKFKTSTHTKGEHASPLIYAGAKADFLEIDQNKFEIVAITGNSMGWYLTLALAQATNPRDSFKLIHTMGSMMKQGLIGGQVIYPIVDENWQVDHGAQTLVEKTILKVNQQDNCQVYISIFLGGYLVLAGNKAGLSALVKELPQKEHYPLQLVNHGAFHTPLLESISEKAFIDLKELKFSSPQIPMIDGRGKIWQPYSTDPHLLRQYTLGHQVTETYDFSRAISVTLKEFSPDHLVLLGPGNSLGGAIGQIIIANKWKGMNSKGEFLKQQKEKPFLLSMGLDSQKERLT